VINVIADSGEAENVDVDAAKFRETQKALRAIEVLEDKFLAIETRSRDVDESEETAVKNEDFEKLKNEMKNAQTSLHTLAEGNIAFKSEHPELRDALKDRIEGYDIMARRFKKVIEEFETLHSNQLDALEVSLNTMSLGYNDLVDSKGDSLKIANPGKNTMENFLRDVKLKEGAEKTGVIRACIEEKKILHDRIYFMKHLITDMNAVLTMQEGLLVGGDCANTAGVSYLHYEFSRVGCVSY